MSSASCLQASDFSPLNSCLSNGFTSGGWTWIQSDGSEAFFLRKLVLGCYLLHLVSPHASSLMSFPLLAPPPWGSLHASHTFLFRFTQLGTANTILICHLD